jgi:hypothetical protein
VSSVAAVHKQKLQLEVELLTTAELHRVGRTKAKQTSSSKVVLQLLLFLLFLTAEQITTAVLNLFCKLHLKKESFTTSKKRVRLKNSETQK